MSDHIICDIYEQYIINNNNNNNNNNTSPHSTYTYTTTTCHMSFYTLHIQGGGAISFKYGDFSCSLSSLAARLDCFVQAVHNRNTKMILVDSSDTYTVFT
jgi:hypothetical protein